jgi:hypothetical protein
MRWVRRIPEGLLILFALPAYQLWHIAKYANTRKVGQPRLAYSLISCP